MELTCERDLEPIKSQRSIDISDLMNLSQYLRDKVKSHEEKQQGVWIVNNNKNWEKEDHSLTNQYSEQNEEYFVQFTTPREGDSTREIVKEADKNLNSDFTKFRENFVESQRRNFTDSSDKGPDSKKIKMVKIYYSEDESQKVYITNRHIDTQQDQQYLRSFEKSHRKRSGNKSLSNSKLATSTSIVKNDDLKRYMNNVSSIYRKKHSHSIHKLH